MIRVRADFTYSIKLDADRKGPPRMFLLYDEAQTEDEVIVLLQKDSKYCKSIYVYLNVSKYLSIAQFHVSLSILHRTNCETS